MHTSRCSTGANASVNRGPILVDLLPGQVSGQQHYTPVVNPRSGEPFGVPALDVPHSGRLAGAV